MESTSTVNGTTTQPVLGAKKTRRPRTPKLPLVVQTPPIDLTKATHVSVEVRLEMLTSTHALESANQAIALVEKEEEILKLRRASLAEKVELILSQGKEFQAKVWSTYGLGPNDSISFTTGEITRIPVVASDPNGGVL